jgi:hypothetical protein
MRLFFLRGILPPGVKTTADVSAYARSITGNPQPSGVKYQQAVTDLWDALAAKVASVLATLAVFFNPSSK